MHFYLEAPPPSKLPPPNPPPDPPLESPSPTDDRIAPNITPSKNLRSQTIIIIITTTIIIIVHKASCASLVSFSLI